MPSGTWNLRAVHQDVKQVQPQTQNKPQRQWRKAAEAFSFLWCRRYLFFCCNLLRVYSVRKYSGKIFQRQPENIQSWSAPLRIYLCRQVCEQCCSHHSCLSQCTHAQEKSKDGLQRSCRGDQARDVDGTSALLSCVLQQFRLLNHLVTVRDRRWLRLIMKRSTCSAAGFRPALTFRAFYQHKTLPDPRPAALNLQNNKWNVLLNILQMLNCNLGSITSHTKHISSCGVFAFLRDRVGEADLSSGATIGSTFLFSTSNIHWADCCGLQNFAEHDCSPAPEC